MKRVASIDLTVYVLVEEAVVSSIWWDSMGLVPTLESFVSEERQKWNCTAMVFLLRTLPANSCGRSGCMRLMMLRSL